MRHNSFFKKNKITQRFTLKLIRINTQNKEYWSIKIDNQC